jgi:hypothetical protein
MQLYGSTTVFDILGDGYIVRQHVNFLGKSTEILDNNIPWKPDPVPPPKA